MDGVSLAFLMTGLPPTILESASIQDYSDILIGGIGMFDERIDVHLVAVALRGAR
jgi:hypothetical protein